MKKTMGAFLVGQRRKVPPVVSARLTGKTVVIVGANTGIGLEATKHFARMNPKKLILACRSQSKGDAAVAHIKQETGYDGAEVWLVDLTSFASVSAFGDRFEKEGIRLDILVANAAVAGFDYITTKDGWEQTIVVVGSVVHYFHTFNDEVFEAESSFRLLSSKEYCTPKEMENRYNASKLLNLCFVMSLAELLKDTPVIATTVCPGYCYSDLRRDFKGIRAVVDWLMERAFAWTTEEGSRQLVYGAVGASDDPKRLNGAFIDLTQVTEPSDHIIGVAGKMRRDKLWDDLIRELTKVDYRVAEIVQEYLI